VKRWRNTDTIAVLAILGGALSSVWIAGPFGFSFHFSPAQKQDAASPPAVQGEPVTSGVPFHATSLESEFSVRGDYAGMMSWDGSVIRVTLPHALLTRMADRPEGERLKAIRLGVANGSGESWIVVSEGAAERIQELAEGEERVLHDLALTVAAKGDLACAWLVLIHELEYLDEHGAIQPAWTYTHSDRASLAALTGLKVDCSGR
jgi:hypothetical protein